PRGDFGEAGVRRVISSRPPSLLAAFRYPTPLLTVSAAGGGVYQLPLKGRENCRRLLPCRTGGRKPLTSERGPCERPALSGCHCRRLRDRAGHVAGHPLPGRVRPGDRGGAPR